jgi:hypothetical protein
MHRTCIVIVTAALVLALVLVGACQREQGVLDAPTIDWHTSPLDLDLRGMNGSRYRFHCPAGKPQSGAVIGSGPYTDGSSICTAAVHAGAIDAQRGGTVTIQVLPGESRYAGSTQNFVTSQGYAEPWGGSFAVLPATDSGVGKTP